MLESVCAELAERTARQIKPIVLRSYDKLRQLMQDGVVQIAWAPPLVAIELERDAKANVRLCSRRAGKLDYMSAIFVKADTSMKTIGDLRGKRIAWVAKESSAGYLVPRLRIAAEGLDLETLFAEETFRRTHEAAVRAVMSGDVDAGATFASFHEGSNEPVSAGWLEAGYKAAEVRVLATAGPIPSDVIAMASNLGEDTKVALSEALRELGAPVKALLNADSFERPETTHFDALRRLVDSAKEHAH
jgi:phosphonate transport system substrate-binding protein